MRIGIEAAGLTSKKTGIGQSNKYMIKALVSIDDKNEYVIFGQEKVNFYSEIDRANVKIVLRTTNHYILFHQLILPLLANRENVDILHCTSHSLPFLYRKKIISTVHTDPAILGEKMFSSKRSIYLSLFITCGLPRAHMILVPTDITKKRLVESSRISEDEIAAIPWGISRNFSPVIDQGKQLECRRKYGLRGPYILCVHALATPLKNALRLVKAYGCVRRTHVFPHKLVLVGEGHDMEYPRKALSLVKSMGIEEEVIFTGYVQEEDLPTIYTMADLSIVPSLDESFGFATLESMGCGTPVIASNIPALQEVLGDSAFFVDPYKEHELAESISEILGSESLREILIEKGFERVKLFSWDSYAERLLRVYESVYLS